MEVFTASVLIVAQSLDAPFSYAWPSESALFQDTVTGYELTICFCLMSAAIVLAFAASFLVVVLREDDATFANFYPDTNSRIKRNK